MRGRFTATLEFREIKLRWNIQREIDLFHLADSTTFFPN